MDQKTTAAAADDRFAAAMRQVAGAAAVALQQQRDDAVAATAAALVAANAALEPSQAVTPTGQGGGGGTRCYKKLTPFSSGRPREWQAWRIRFCEAAAINNWEDERSRREIRSLMTGTAAIFVHDINPVPMVALPEVFTAENLLDLYQLRFCPVAAAQVAFDQTGQRAGETLGGWHSRLRNTFLNAYPRQKKGLEDNTYLMRKFILGIASPQASKHTYMRRPETYTACLREAVKEQLLQERLAGEAVKEKLLKEKLAGEAAVRAVPDQGEARQGLEPASENC